MRIAERSTGVRADVAGDVVVDEEELARKLGASAWLVWQVLAAKRSREGVSRCYGSQLMNARGFQSFSKRVMQKALRRLEQAGLVERIGYQELPTATKAGVRMASVHTRKVFGARLLHVVGTVAKVAVPRSTAAWMATATGRGGARSGAGRRSNRIQAVSPITEFKRYPIMCNSSSVGTKGLMVSSSPSEKKESAPGGATSSLVSESESAIGTAIIGSASRAQHVAIASIGADVPPYPGYSIVSPAIVPHPPLLKETAKGAELVAVLMNAYRGALEAFYDVRLPRRKNATVKPRDRKVLLAAAAVLFDKKIPPATWCWWRIERYASAKLPAGAKRPAHPPIAYVFSEKALTTNRWMFRAAWGDGLIGGRMVFGPKLKALLQRYREMHAAIVQGATRRDAKQNFFPDDLYDQMVDAAKIEANEMTNKLILRIERGEYVWR